MTKEMDFMLQRKMDSSVDYGTPLVISERGWLHNFLNRKEKADNIPVINSKVSNQDRFWGKLKYTSRIDTSIQIIGIIILGTLLGAAYAVTTQGWGKQEIKKVNTIATSSTEQKIENDLSEPSTELSDTTPDDIAFTISPVKEEISDDLLASLDLLVPEIKTEINSPKVISPSNDKLNNVSKDTKEAKTIVISTPNKSFRITQVEPMNKPSEKLDESVYSNIIIPKKFIPKVVEKESTLSERERKIILKLERKLALTQKKIKNIDKENLRLQGKFETLIVKNRALSEQLRSIDDVSAKLKSTIHR